MSIGVIMPRRRVSSGATFLKVMDELDDFANLDFNYGNPTLQFRLEIKKTNDIYFFGPKRQGLWGGGNSIGYVADLPPMGVTGNLSDEFSLASTSAPESSLFEFKQYTKTLVNEASRDFQNTSDTKDLYVGYISTSNAPTNPSSGQGGSTMWSVWRGKHTPIGSLPTATAHYKSLLLIFADASGDIIDYCSLDLLSVAGSAADQPPHFIVISDPVWDVMQSNANNPRPPKWGNPVDPFRRDDIKFVGGYVFATKYVSGFSPKSQNQAFCEKLSQILGL